MIIMEGQGVGGHVDDFCFTVRLQCVLFFFTMVRFPCSALNVKVVRREFKYSNFFWTNARKIIDFKWC